MTSAIRVLGTPFNTNASNNGLQTSRKEFLINRRRSLRGNSVTFLLSLDSLSPRPPPSDSRFLYPTLLYPLECSIRLNCSYNTRIERNEFDERGGRQREWGRKEHF